MRHLLIPAFLMFTTNAMAGFAVVGYVPGHSTVAQSTYGAGGVDLSSGMPLTYAVKQILPAGWRSFYRRLSPDMRVTFSPVGGFTDQLQSISNHYRLRFRLDWEQKRLYVEPMDAAMVSRAPATAPTVPATRAPAANYAPSYPSQAPAAPVAAYPSAGMTPVSLPAQTWLATAVTHWASRLGYEIDWRAPNPQLAADIQLQGDVRGGLQQLVNDYQNTPTPLMVSINGNRIRVCPLSTQLC